MLPLLLETALQQVGDPHDDPVAHRELKESLRCQEFGNPRVDSSFPVQPHIIRAAVDAIVPDRMRHSKRRAMVGALGLLAPAVATLWGLWLVRAPVIIYLNLFALPLFVAWRTCIILGASSEAWEKVGYGQSAPEIEVDGRYNSNDLLSERSLGDQYCPFLLGTELVFATMRAAWPIGDPLQPSERDANSRELRSACGGHAKAGCSPGLAGGVCRCASGNAGISKGARSAKGPIRLGAP
jgi:hypothetical protein